MDIIEQLLRAPAELLARIMGRKTVPKEVYTAYGILASDEIDYLIDALIRARRFDRAEDLLFAQIELSRANELYGQGIEMYARMAAFSDAELTAAGFSRTEIAQGIADLSVLYAEKTPKNE